VKNVRPLAVVLPLVVFAGCVAPPEQVAEHHPPAREQAGPRSNDDARPRSEASARDAAREPQVRIAIPQSTPSSSGAALGQAAATPSVQVPTAPTRELKQRAAEGVMRHDVPAASSGSIAAPSPTQPQATWPSVDRFPDKHPGGTIAVAEQPVSTFSIDVDTASYAFVRRHLSSGRLPPRESVRVEEMVNYFPYQYPAPRDRAQPFRITTAVMPTPWAADKQLLHIAVRGYDLAANARPRANVVLLIDTSGSMSPADRLPLLKQGFRLFAAQLRDEDRVAIVTYAGNAQVALDPTPGSERERIVEAIERLQAGGSTAGADGLQRAYALAERHFDPKAVNRVILATDGDFNVGITDPRELERFIAGKRKTGVYLSILGVGQGNINDALMQRLAQAGNGNAAYVDSLLEARKVMSDELASTLFPIADDVKIQVEFNPARVAAYRLVGYETRTLRREDFNDDKVDAGDVGAGHTVTAIYEISPAGTTRVDPLRYQGEVDRPASVRGDELAFVKLRYKLPREAASRLIEQPVSAMQVFHAFEAAPTEQRFAVAVAAFAQRLRGEPTLDHFGYSQIAELASGARGSDVEGYRAEFVRLVRMADALGVARLGR
jgi:Ca-activated chloride channel family protein